MPFLQHGISWVLQWYPWIRSAELTFVSTFRSGIGRGRISLPSVGGSRHQAVFSSRPYHVNCWVGQTFCAWDIENSLEGIKWPFLNVCCTDLVDVCQLSSQFTLLGNTALWEISSQRPGRGSDTPSVLGSLHRVNDLSWVRHESFPFLAHGFYK